ncbi:MAG: polysaccharide deacetylase family protein [Acidimicrobiia bacterium]|nr:polysaccharide deacetylase family protein [Acidimicrobiia bacterium]
MRVTLTFDNGPSVGTTPMVLDALAARALPATFFVVGERLDRPGGRELVERAAAEGHWIGNHSLTHAVPLGDDPDPAHAEREIGETQARLGDVGHERRFFRPFGGGGRLGPHLLSPAAVDVLRRGRYTCVLWNSVPHDWDDLDGWVDTALADVARLEHAVVVLHDLPTGAMADLPVFLDRLAALDAVVVQDFPPAVVPIERGVPAGAAALAGLVSEAA